MKTLLLGSYANNSFYNIDFYNMNLRVIRAKRNSKSIDMNDTISLDLSSQHKSSSFSQLKPKIKLHLKSSNCMISNLKLPKLVKSPKSKVCPGKIVSTNFQSLAIKSYYSKSTVLPDLAPTIKKYTPFLDNPLSSSSDSDRVEPIDVKATTEHIYKHFIEAVIINQCEPIALMCISELMSASLRLFSSSILDSIMREVLNEFISEITVQTIIEILDSDYINYQEELINREVLEQINWIAIETSENVISNSICSEILESLNVSGIVKVCIAEERKSNKLLYQSMVDLLVDKIVHEDWIEILAEDEFCAAKLHHNVKIMPIKVQKEIFRKGNDRLLESAIEEIYFDILNEFVAGIWLRNVVSYYYTFPGVIFEIDTIMPLTDQKNLGRKRGSVTCKIDYFKLF